MYQLTNKQFDSLAGKLAAIDTIVRMMEEDIKLTTNSSRENRINLLRRYVDKATNATMTAEYLEESK